MSDLISRQTVIDLIDKRIAERTPDKGSIWLRNDEAIDIQTEVENLPTAYDVDKVVEELENRASLRDKIALSTTDVNERYSYIESAEAYRQAILIVKGAIKDE